MRISRIAIGNHRRVADFDLDLRGHAALVGPNAVGKSTVLRLIDCLLGATWGRLAATLDVEQLRDVAAPMTVEVRLEGLSADDLAHFADKVQVGIGENAGRIWLNARLDASVSIADPEKLDISRSFIKPMVDDAAISREDLRLIGWTFLPASRSPDRDLGSGPSGAIRSLLQAVSLDVAESTAIEDALKQFDDALTSSPSLGELRAEFAAELSALFPEPVGKDDVSISLPSASAAEPLNDVSVQLQRDGAKVPLSDQSDGLRSLALVAVQLLARRSARILAIDEPEIHLHPRGQATLGALLASAPGQRLVATHSPAVLAQFAPKDAIAITSEGARQLPASAFAGKPKQAEHWWVDSALEPLTAKRVVFVEGISDRIIVKSVAQLMGVNLDRCGVSVVALNGSGGFKAAIRLFGPAGFGVRILGLVDEKEQSDPADALGVSTTDLLANDILTCYEDLEDEYVTGLGVADTVAILVGSGLFSEAGLVAATGATDATSIDSVPLIGFARRNKVEVAAALARGMSNDQAVKLTTVVDLISRAAS